MVLGSLNAQISMFYTVDLREPKEAKILVKAIPGSVTFPAIFKFPKMVPGTYAVYDFGRFVDTIFVWSDGNKNGIARKNTNHWLFESRPDSIEYIVSQTWYHSQYNQYVFEPAGTFFDNHSVILNNHACFGYWDGLAEKPLEINFLIPEGWYASTSLSFEQNANLFQFKPLNYAEWVDSPILFSKPDTVSINIGSTHILISVVNPSERVKATAISSTLYSMLNGAEKFLGGLPVSSYAFLFYIPDEIKSLSAGALEHNKSSFYYLPFIDFESLLESIKDIAAHEFFHILTPLNLHSEEIHFFDYDQPDMSAHLWLYEGVTEYNSGLMQIRQGLISKQSFLDWIMSKKYGSEKYSSTLPFYDLSKGVLGKYKREYGNVYQKGALIGMCLDLLIISESGGEIDLLDVINSLIKDYGPDRPFKDDELFDLITQYSSASSKNFLHRHVIGSEPLPLDSLLLRVGVKFDSKVKDSITNIGFNVQSLNYFRSRGEWYIGEEIDIYKNGKKSGLKSGDFIIAVNELTLDSEDSQTRLLGWIETLKPKESIYLKVKRIKLKKGQEKVRQYSIQIKSELILVDGAPRYIFDTDQRDEIIQNRNKWINH